MNTGRQSALFAIPLCHGSTLERAIFPRGVIDKRGAFLAMDCLLQSDGMSRGDLLLVFDPFSTKSARQMHWINSPDIFVEQCLCDSESNASMATIQKYHRGQLAPRIHLLWWSCSSVPDGRIIIQLDRKTYTHQVQFHEKFVKRLGWIDEAMVGDT